MWSKPGSPRSKVIDALAGVLCFLVWVVMDFPFLGGHGPDPKPGSQGWGGGGVAGRDLYESPKTLTPTATATATTSKAAATATADAYTSSSGSNSNKSLHVIICHHDDHNNRLGVRSQTTSPPASPLHLWIWQPLRESCCVVCTLLASCRLDYVQRISRTKGLHGLRARWFSCFDSAAAALRHRHTLMFLADAAILLQSGNPFLDVGVQFGDTLDNVHKKCGQSLLVLSSILRDTTLFQAVFNAMPPKLQGP